MATVTVKTRDEHLADMVRRVGAYTNQLTYFGQNGVARGLLQPVATAAENSDRLYMEILNRVLVQNASGDALLTVCESRGTRQGPATNAKVLAIVQPATATVSGVAVFSGAYDDITLTSGAAFTAGDSIRIRYVDSSTGTTYSDARTIDSKPSSNVLRVATLTERTAAQYDAQVSSTLGVKVLFRATIPQSHSITTTAGVTFETLTSITTGDANAALAGEGESLALADKVWCECTVSGEAGNIEPLTLVGFSPAITGVSSIFNPERGSGGAAVEAPAALKQRTVEGPQALTQETLTWLLAIFKQINPDVLRLIKVTTGALSTIAVKVLKANGGTFTSDELTALEEYAALRCKSETVFEAANVTLTSVEVEAVIGLAPGYTLAAVWKDAASRLASYLDYRRWGWGVDVDEAQLLSIVSGTPGVASLVTSAFLPAADVSVGAESIPILTRLSLQDQATLAVANATLAVSF